MREIRFRGKEHTGDWITGGYVQKNGVPHIVAHIVDRGVDEWRAIPVIPATVGQYTGLRDKNGVEIYEGDVLQIKDQCGLWHTVSVRYEPPMFVADCGGGAWFSLLPTCHIEKQEYEVVGNVHDAPELLK